MKVTENGKIVPEMKDIFQLVKDYDAVLGTAHISPEESFIVCDAARAAGVKKLVVTHPEWWVVDMSIEDQKRIVKDYDVLLERCYAQNMGGGKYKSNLPKTSRSSVRSAIRTCSSAQTAVRPRILTGRSQCSSISNICRIMVCRTTRFTTCRIPLRQACSASSNAEEVE